MGYSVTAITILFSLHEVQKQLSIWGNRIPFVTIEIFASGKYSRAILKKELISGWRSGSPPSRFINLAFPPVRYDNRSISLRKSSTSRNSGSASGEKCVQPMQFRLQCSARWNSKWKSYTVERKLRRIVFLINCKSSIILFSVSQYSFFRRYGEYIFLQISSNKSSFSRFRLIIMYWSLFIKLSILNIGMLLYVPSSIISVSENELRGRLARLEGFNEYSNGLIVYWSTKIQNGW